MARQETILYRWFDEVWNRRRKSAIDQMMAPNCVIEGLPDTAGHPAFKAFHKKLLSEFPTLTIYLANVRTNKDRISADCMVIGKHAKGKAVDFPGKVQAWVKRGRIVKAKNDFDFARMEAQIK
jgi:hypothetical protein